MPGSDGAGGGGRLDRQLGYPPSQHIGSDLIEGWACARLIESDQRLIGSDRSTARTGSGDRTGSDRRLSPRPPARCGAQHAVATGLQPLWAVTPLRGVNDTAADGVALAALAKRFEALTGGIRPRVSVVPYNTIGAPCHVSAMCQP